MRETAATRWFGTANKATRTACRLQSAALQHSLPSVVVSCRNQVAQQRVAWSCVPRDTHTSNWLGSSPLQQLWRLSSARFDDWLHTLVHGKWVPVHDKHQRSCGKGSVGGRRNWRFLAFWLPRKARTPKFHLPICTIVHTSIPLAAAVCMQESSHQRLILSTSVDPLTYCLSASRSGCAWPSPFSASM